MPLQIGIAVLALGELGALHRRAKNRWLGYCREVLINLSSKCFERNRAES